MTRDKQVERRDAAIFIRKCAETEWPHNNTVKKVLLELAERIAAGDHDIVAQVYKKR